jgi:hypothetical protein
MSFLVGKLFGDNSEEEEERQIPVVEETEVEEEEDNVTPRRSGRSKQQIDYNYNRRNNKRPTSPTQETPATNKAKTRKMSDKGEPTPFFSNTHPVGHSPAANKTKGRPPNTAKAGGGPEERSDEPGFVGRLEAFMASMKQGLEEKIDGGNTRLKKEIGDINRNVNSIAEGLNRKVDNLAEDLDNFKKKTDRRDAALDKRITALEIRPQGASSRETREETAYWEARRSLRLCPICPKDTMAGIRAFLIGTLDLDGTIVDRVDPHGVRRPPSRPGTKFEKEVVVTFKNVADRDTVKAAAFRLADKPGNHCPFFITTQNL